MTRFYLSARYERRTEMLEYARVLAEFDHIVTSDWILGKHEGTPRLDWAMEDLAALRRTDCVIYFSDPVVSRSRFVEWGIAIGLEIGLAIIGDNKETPFHLFTRAHLYRNWNEFRCMVLESTSQTDTGESPQASINPLESTSLEQKLERARATFQYPQHFYGGHLPNPSTSPQEQK